MANYQRKIPVLLDCGLNLFHEVTQGKWKMNLIYYIHHGIKRPGELQRKIPKATRRVLDAQLSQLVKHGLLTKIIFPGLPLRVEYELTGLCKTLVPVIDTIVLWGETHRLELEALIIKDEGKTPGLPA